MRISMASEYQVYIGWVPGFVAEYNNTQSYISDSSGQLITHFGGRNSAGGVLGTGVQNSPRANFPTPDKMQVTWLSFVDGQFWQAQIELPAQQIEKLLHEQIQGVFVSDPYHKVQRYNRLVVNVGPKGQVYIYLGGADIKLIGTYQAKTVDIPWETHIQQTWSSAPAKPISQQQYLAKAQDAHKNTLQKTKLFNAKIFNPVKWRLAVKAPNQLIAYTAKMMNGEDQTVLDPVATSSLSAIPELFIFDVKRQNQVKRYRVSLDRDIFAFYYQNFDPSKRVTFEVEFLNQDEVNLYLQQDLKKIEFKAIDVEELTR